MKYIARVIPRKTSSKKWNEKVHLELDLAPVLVAGLADFAVLEAFPKMVSAFVAFGHSL